MNPEMATPISDLAPFAILAWLGFGVVFGRVPSRVRARLAKRAGKAKR